MSSILNLPIGINNLLGTTLAHEVGHVIGFVHPAEPEFETVKTYQECGLDLRYPQFNWCIDDGDTSTTMTTTTDNEVYDPLLDITYRHEDWNARSNIMSRPNFNNLVPVYLANVFGIGLYKSGYGPIYDQITQCWFDRAT
jgi:hypothetical protein